MINGFDTPDQLTTAIVRAAKAAGMIGCGRYISGGGQWKHLTPAEVEICKAEGFGLWFIDEGTGDAAQFVGDGLAAGHKARDVARGFGALDGTPIFVGVDFPADDSDVPAISRYMADYQTGVAPYLGGMYADGLIASAIPTPVGDFLPGASGWPGYAAYRASGKVALLQHPPVKMFGIDIDPVEIFDTKVLWFPGSAAVPVVAPQPPVEAPPPAPSPAPAPSPTREPQDIGNMPALETLQRWLVSDGYLEGGDNAVDGLWGPETLAAIVAAYEGSHD